MIGEKAVRSLQLVSGISLCGSAPAEEWEGFWPSLVARIVYDLDEAGNEAASETVAGILTEMWRLLVPPMTLTEEYNLACARLDRATGHLEVARKAASTSVLAAEAEYRAARAALGRYESSPGIPKPEYDPLRQEGSPEADAGQGRPDVTRGATPAQVREWAGGQLMREGASLAEIRAWVSSQLELWQQRQEGAQES